MKLRIFVDHQSTYDYFELDTDKILVSSCINRYTGHIHLRHCSEDDSIFRDCLPSLFINDLINDLIDKN